MTLTFGVSRIVLVVAVAAATSHCGGRVDGEADASDATMSDEPANDAADAGYQGQCCDIYDGSTAGPCDHDADDNGFGGSPLDNEAGVYFCGYAEAGGADQWRHCAYVLGHRWGCCVPSDITCCPRVAEPFNNNPPAAPGACNGFEPADGF